MKFNILTIFPEMFEMLNKSIVKRAMDNSKISLEVVDIRKFSKNKHKKVDFPPFGGGAGMIINPECIYDAYSSIINDQKIDRSTNDKTKVIYLSPKGNRLNHKKILELSNQKNLTLICGHYEGIDQRIIDLIVDEEISIGDYILTNGELPAMVLIDGISRQIDGVISKESLEDESFSNQLLEYCQYTKPREFQNMKVPEVLLSGDHQKIEKYRRYSSIEETFLKRPDLLTDDVLKTFSNDEMEFLDKLRKK